MTEPREPEPTLDDGEATRPIEAQRTEPAPWYPVDGRTADTEPEAGAAPEPDPVEEPTVAQPQSERQTDVEPEQVVEPEPAAVAEPEPEPEPEPVAEPVAVERVQEAEPAAVEREPEAVPATGQPDPAAEPVEPEPAAVTETDAERRNGDVADEETVAVAAGQPHRTLFGDAEPTVATQYPAGAPAEETVALTPEPVGQEPTTVLPQEPTPQPHPLQNAPAASIFRQPSPNPEFEHTRMEQLSDEEQKLAAERAARRDARATALAASAPVPLAAPEPVIVHKRTNDGFWGSVGLFLLRLVLAAILAVRGLNLLTDIPAAQASFAKTVIPYPGIMAIVTGVAALLIALALVLGLLTRIAGLGIALIGGGALAFVYWGNWSPFVAGRPGFLGDYELLLTATGILLLCIGAGGWSLDRSVRAGRERNKAERASASE